jgi:alcohol dehydrogenase YqhD (iron-dependent ADH family)
MWASSLSHNGLTGAGDGLGDWAPHQLGHELSARFDTAHGAALSAIWGSWARYVYKQNPARFAHFAMNVLDLPNEDSEEELALTAIEEMESFFWGLEMPTGFADLGLKLNAKEIDKMVEGCSHGGTRTIGGFRVLGQADMEKIYEMANEIGRE